jgi:hypothetical protein
MPNPTTALGFPNVREQAAGTCIPIVTRGPRPPLLYGETDEPTDESSFRMHDDRPVAQSRTQRSSDLAFLFLTQLRVRMKAADMDRADCGLHSYYLGTRDPDLHDDLVANNTGVLTKPHQTSSAKLMMIIQALPRVYDSSALRKGFSRE